MNKIPGKIEILSNSSSRYNIDTNTLTLDDSNTGRVAVMMLKREGDGKVCSWGFNSGFEFISGVYDVSNDGIVTYIISAWDCGNNGSITSGGRIWVNEGTNHKAAYVDINLVSNARIKINKNAVKLLQSKLVYNGLEQTVDRLSECWTYEVSTEGYDNFDGQNADYFRNLFIPPYDALPILDELIEFTSGVTATQPGTYQPYAKLKNKTRYRWSGEKETDNEPVYTWGWQWSIDKYELQADVDDITGFQFGGTDTSIRVSTNGTGNYGLINDASTDDRFEFTIWGMQGFSQDDLTLTAAYDDSRGAYIEFVKTIPPGFWTNDTGLVYRYYPRWTKAGQTGFVTVGLSDSGKAKYLICGSTNTQFKFYWKANTWG